MRYERHSSLSWGASAFRGSCAGLGEDGEWQDERAPRRMGTNEFDGNGLRVEKVRPYRKKRARVRGKDGEGSEKGKDLQI